MIENIECLSPQTQVHAFGTDAKILFQKRRKVVDRPPPACIPSDYRPVDHWPVRGRACITTIVRSSNEIERQSGSQGRHAPNVEPEGRAVVATQYKPVPLIENRIAFLLQSGKVRIVRVPAGGVRV